MIINCKMCGSKINVSDDSKVVTCEVCGSNQVVPHEVDNKEIELFNEANKFRLENRYDQALTIYEEIIKKYPDEIEAYWGYLLCKYGIEYVDDILENKKVPTCHRTINTSIFDEKEYLYILENASLEKKIYYQNEAKRIDDLQNEIKRNIDDTKYDIFICYKETDFNESRTKDSQYASLFYSKLTEKGYKVFYAKESLKGVIGNYEPYIYNALRSAKIMLLIGTRKEFIEAPWVRNEWSRFLELTRKDLTKRIAPIVGFKDINDLPFELRKFQIQDLSALDYFEVLMRSIDSAFSLKEETTSVEKDEKEKTTSLSNENKEFNLYLTTKNESEKISHLMLAVSQEFTPAITELGRCYLYGKYYPRDINKAQNYLKTAIDRNDNKAKALLAECYIKNKITTKYNEAFILANEASEYENQISYDVLGLCYQFGYGTTKNPELAIKNYKIAADNGYVNSMMTLGKIYMKGDIVQRNYTLAYQYMKKAGVNTFKNRSFLKF